MAKYPLKHLIEDFLTHREERRNSPHTIKTYGSRLRHFAEFVGELRPAPTSLDVIYGFLTHVADGGSGRKPAAPNTVAHAHRVLSAFYGYLEQRRVISFNPMRAVEPPEPTVDQARKPETLSPEELKLLLDAVRNDLSTVDRYDGRDPNRRLEEHIFFCLFGLLGLTAGEVASLKQSDVRDKGERLEITSSRRPRSLPLPMELQVSLIDYVRPVGHEFLFGSPDDPRQPLQTYSLNQRIPRLAKQAGLDRRVTPSLLRDTCLTRVVAEKGMGAAMSLSGLSSQSLAKYLPDKDDVAANDPRTRALHPFVRQDVEAKFLRGEFADAVEKAAKAVLQHIRNRSGEHDLDGDPLIKRAFGPTSGVLRINAGRTKTDRDEAKGFMTMLEGFNMHVRNVHAHRHTVEMDEERAIEYLTTASLLCRVVDRATPRVAS